VGQWKRQGWGWVVDREAPPAAIDLISLELTTHGESLNATKVGLLPPTPLHGCQNFCHPVVCGLVKKVQQIEFEVMSVTKRKDTCTSQQF